MNLLVLRLATINAEEQVQERLEAAEARRNAVHLEGDVIQPNTRLFNTTEKPEQVETISVCSCACLDYKIWHHQQNGQSHHPKKSSSLSTDPKSQRRSIPNRLRDESSVIISESGGVGNASRRRWRHTFITPTLKRLLPGRLHRRQKRSQFEFGSSLNSQIHNEIEFEMMIKQENEPAVSSPAAGEILITETNLLNLDAINLCSSNVKRNSIWSFWSLSWLCQFIIISSYSKRKIIFFSFRLKQISHRFTIKRNSRRMGRFNRR